MTYLIKRKYKYCGSIYTEYYDWFLEKFVRNEEHLPLTKLYTKQFNTKEDVINLLDSNKEMFNMTQIVETK